MKPQYWITALTVFSMVVVFVVWYHLPGYLITKYGKPDGAGEYGDVYGSITALFTSLAFALLIYTALMQREELKLQRLELELNRKELQKSAEAQEQLVKLSIENNEFQKHLRKHEVYPELELINQHSYVVDNATQKFELTFKPKFYALVISGLKIITEESRVNFDKKNFNDHYLERVIAVNNHVIIAFEYIFETDLPGYSFEIHLYDVDRKNSYKQLVINYQGIWRARGSTEQFF